MMDDSRQRRVQLGLFDFDGTLVKGDSFIRFGVYAVGRIGFGWAFIKATPWLVAWQFGRISSSEAKEKLFEFLFRGMEKTEFDLKCRLFAGEIDRMLRPDVLREMERLCVTGGRVVIVTASVGDWIRFWAVRKGVEKVIATEVEVDRNGRLTGRFLTRNCRGGEKVRRIKEYLTEMSGTDENEDTVLEKYEIHAWGNLPDDKEMLEMADFPHSV